MSPTYAAQQLGQQHARGGRSANEPTGPGLHGTGITSTAYGNTTLQPGNTANELTYAAATTFVVAFTNQGENPEYDVKVTLKIAGSGSTITATGSVPQIAKGATARVTLKLPKAPTLDASTPITVTVAKVPGEKNLDNNTSTYQSIFSR